MNYHFSKDYELLWELAQKQEVIYKQAGLLKFTSCPNYSDSVGLGSSWFYSDYALVKYCEKHHLQFLIPGEVDELIRDLKDWTTRLDKVFLSNTAIKEIKELLKKYEVSND
jgi:hypothetical protein